MLPLAALLLPFAVGVMLTALQSLGIGVPAGSAQGGLSLYGWRTLLHGGAADSLLYGVRVAGLSAAISVVLGMVAAYGVWRLPRRWQWAGLLPRVPLILPHIAVAWLVVLVCARSGVLSSLSYALGMTAGQGDFPALLYGGDGWGMIIAYVWKETPFVMLLVVASLRRLDPRLVEMGRMLGGGRWRTFRAVVLPHVAPVLRVCLVILFLYALGAVEVPFVLGETRPVMPGIAAYNAFFHGDFAGRPAAMALLSALFVFGVGVVALYAFLEGRCLSGLLTGRVMGRAQDGRLPSDPMQDGYPSGRQQDWRHSGDLLSSACRWAAMRAASVPDVRGRRWSMGGAVAHGPSGVVVEAVSVCNRGGGCFGSSGRAGREDGTPRQRRDASHRTWAAPFPFPVAGKCAPRAGHSRAGGRVRPAPACPRGAGGGPGVVVARPVAP